MDTKTHPCVSLLCVPVCVKEGQVCGNGTAYSGITCCAGLQCTGIHCNRPGGMEMSLKQVKYVLFFFFTTSWNCSFNFPHLIVLNLQKLSYAQSCSMRTGEPSLWKWGFLSRITLLYRLTM